MKNTKRILAVVIALTMVIGMFASVSAASAKKWYSDAVTYLESAGIAKIGTKAETKLTRAEFVLWVAKLESGAYFVDSGKWKNDGLADVIVFSDVDTSVDGIYRSAINYCYQRKFVVGNGDGTFSPDAKVTLAQASAVIVRLMGYNNKVTNLEDWQYNYFNVANNYCHAFDKTFADNLPAVDAEYELTYGEAAYLLATILNFGAAPTDPSAIAQLPCLTAEGENLGEKFPRGTFSASSQIAIVSDVDFIEVYYDLYGGTGKIYDVNGNLTNYTSEGGTLNYNFKSGTTWTDWGFDANTKTLDFVSNVIDPSSSVTLNLINEDGTISTQVTLSVSSLQRLVRRALGKSQNVDVANGEVFNLGDYINNGTVVGVELSASGTSAEVKSLSVATEEAGTRLVSNTFLVLQSTGEKWVRNLDGSIVRYGKYPYLANAESGFTNKPQLPASYTDAKKVSVSGSKLTVGETTYTIVSTRSVGQNEIVVYDAFDPTAPVSASEVARWLPNTAAGEHDVEFTDVDGDGYFDVATIRNFTYFKYVDKTNADPSSNTSGAKYTQGGAVVIDKVVTGSANSDSWKYDSGTSGKIQLVLQAPNANNALRTQYYSDTKDAAGNDVIAPSYPMQYYTVIDIAPLTTAYIESVEKDLVSSGTVTYEKQKVDDTGAPVVDTNGDPVMETVTETKTYYVATLVNVADGTKAKVLIPTKSVYADQRTSVSITIAGQTAKVSVYSGDWMTFLAAEEAARANGIDKVVNEDNTGAWLVDRTVKYATKGAVSGATGQAADMVCVMLDTTSTATQGFIVNVEKTEKGDNTYNVTVAKSGNISTADWCTALDVYFTTGRAPAWNSFTLNKIYWAGDAWTGMRNSIGYGAGLNAFDALVRFAATCTDATDFAQTIETIANDDVNQVYEAYKAIAGDAGMTVETADTLTLASLVRTIYGITDLDGFIAKAQAGKATPADAGLLTGREMLATLGVTDVDAWVARVANGKALGEGRAFSTAALKNIANALKASYDDTTGKVDKSVVDAAEVAKVAGLSVDALAANIEADLYGLRTNANDTVTILTNSLQNHADMIRSGFYTTSKVKFGTATEYGWFTAIVTAKGATSVGTYEVRASASSIWDWDNYSVYYGIFQGQTLLEHTGSTEHVTGYDLTYVSIKKDGAAEYVLQYLGEDSDVYAAPTSTWWTNYSSANSYWADTWDVKGESAWKLNTLSTASYWSQYGSEIILTDVSKKLAAITIPNGQDEVQTDLEVEIATDPYYKKIYSSNGDVTSFERHWTVCKYTVTVTTKYASGDPLKTYIPVVDINGVQIKVTTQAEKDEWEKQTTVDLNGVVSTFEVNDKGYLFKVNTRIPEYKYDAKGNKVLSHTYDFNNMVAVAGSVPTDVVVSDDEIVGLIGIEEMTDRKESGYFPGAYKVTYDGTTHIASGDTPVVIMTPNFKTGDLDGKATTIAGLAAAKAEVFVTYAQVAAGGNPYVGGSSLTMLSVIGELVDKSTAPTQTETEKTYLVYLAHDGVTIEALELGKYFVVRSTYSASEIPSCEDFGSIYRKYSTYTEAKYASEVDVAISTGYYTVKEDGEIVSAAGSTKKGEITEIDALGNLKATMDGKVVDATNYKWTFIYEDFDGNLHVAGSATSVTIASKADVVKSLDAAKNALASAEADYAQAKALKLSAEMQATLKAVVDEKEAALETAKTNSIAKYLDGQFWGVGNSPVYKYINSYKYTYQKEPSPVTFEYTVVDGTYVVFVSSFFA